MSVPLGYDAALPINNSVVQRHLIDIAFEQLSRTGKEVGVVIC